MTIFIARSEWDVTFRSEDDLEEFVFRASTMALEHDEFAMSPARLSVSMGTYLDVIPLWNRYHEVVIDGLRVTGFGSGQVTRASQPLDELLAQHAEGYVVWRSGSGVWVVDYRDQTYLVGGEKTA